jgi:hypothetical protein
MKKRMLVQTIFDGQVEQTFRDVVALFATKDEPVYLEHNSPLIGRGGKTLVFSLPETTTLADAWAGSVLLEEKEAVGIAEPLGFPDKEVDA